MKPLFLVLLLFAGCNTKTNNGEGSHDQHDSANQALYDEVMKVHDEVTPKMIDIYNSQRN